MKKPFDEKAAREHLERKEEAKKEAQEMTRKQLLERVKVCLSQVFLNTDVEVYLIGSIIKPNQFNQHSDVDIVVKNFKGDRFDLWCKIEGLIERNVEIIIYERCDFKEHIKQSGMRVV